MDTDGVAGGSLNAKRLNINGGDANFIVSGDFTSNSRIGGVGGSLTIDGGAASPFGTLLDGGVLNLTSGTLSGSLQLRNASGTAVSVNQLNTVLDISELSINGNSGLSINSGDNVSRWVTLGDGAMRGSHRG